MPGLNPGGQARPDDYNLGRGKVYFATLDGSGFPTGYRFLGNAPEFSVSLETETLEHQSSTGGLKVTDAEVVISQSLGLTLSLDEINFENLSLFMSGSTASHSNTAAGTGITGSGNLTVVDQGRWYDLYAGAGGISTEPSGERIYDTGAMTISGSVAGTDFIADETMGRIFVIDGGNLTAGDHNVDLAANGSAAAAADEVKGVTQTNVAGALKFISENPKTNDHKTEYQFHKVSLKAEGDFGLISDEFTVMQLTGKAESNAAADADSPIVTVRTHANAGT